jgi:hypothetical protein
VHAIFPWIYDEIGMSYEVSGLFHKCMYASVHVCTYVGMKYTKLMLRGKQRGCMYVCMYACMCV